MPTFAQQILNLILQTPGLTDRQITDALLGQGYPQQSTNVTARNLETRGRLIRQRRPDGLIGNYPAGAPPAPEPTPPSAAVSRVDAVDGLSEDDVKRRLETWLNEAGWQTHVAWAKEHGTDIRATRGQERWNIEVKGAGSLNAMRVNYFLGILGETLQRMEDAEAKYSIALPDLQQFRRLWDRLPTLAKRRTGITALFVAESGAVTEVAF